jgi:release factor glutamine methyltransferase
MNLFSISQCLQLSTELDAVSDSARLDVELILCHVMQKNRTWLFTWSDKILTAEQQQLFNKFFSRRKNGEPIAHIIGQREFWSLPLSVNNSTLIPRPDTELLVESVLELFAGDAPQQKRRCLDLGTGTGAIVLALASEKSAWQLVGVDKSDDAIALAEKNRAALQFDHVQMLQSDWFAAFAADQNETVAQQFNVIVSNPPYIDPQDPHLDQGDVRFEPRSALIADNNGLADIELIIQQAWDYLSEQGWLLLEHGYDQGAKVRDLFGARGFVQVETRRDLGGNERVTLGRKGDVS